MICKVDTFTDHTLRLKIVTIVIGILCVILGSVGSCGYANDVFFLVTVLIFTSLSLLHLSCTLLDMFKANCTSRGMDCIYHGIGGVFTLVAAVVLFSETNPRSCHVMEKTSAATVAIFNSFVYLYVSWMILHMMREKDTQSSLPLYFFCVCSRDPVDFLVQKQPPVKNSSSGTRIVPKASYSMSKISGDPPVVQSTQPTPVET